MGLVPNIGLVTPRPLSLPVISRAEVDASEEEDTLIASPSVDIAPARPPSAGLGFSNFLFSCNTVSLLSLSVASSISWSSCECRRALSLYLASPSLLNLLYSALSLRALLALGEQPQYEAAQSPTSARARQEAEITRKVPESPKCRLSNDF